MTIFEIKEVLWWCLVLNVSLLLFWTAMCVFAMDWVYATQKRFYPISREVFVVVMYAFLGLFKLGVILLNVTPYLALLIAESR
ncbi:MAG: hypothetical protein KDA88_03450 [Planctomycetaceae bacterium]|nr:hypothetical protein [Planctomycetaceae bacterium]MCB9952812.1 hypothetical protein [Planctomycetaceae bacterium]